MSTTLPGSAINFLGSNYGSPNSSPLVYLTGATLTANAATFPTLTFAPFASLVVMVNVTGYGGSDVVSLQFNGDTGTNYLDQTITSSAGGTTLTNTNTASTTLIRLGLPTNQARVVTCQILNATARRKLVMINNQIGTTDAATLPVLHLGGMGLWANTSAQITSITCLTAGGANILSGSSIMIFGGI